MAYEENKLQTDKTRHRFQMDVDGHNAFINYKQDGNTVYLIHTETPPELEGKGVASALVEKTLHYLQEQHLQLVPLCTFVQSYLEKHPHWKQLVAKE